MVLQPQRGGRKWRMQNPVSYSYHFIGTHCSETINYLMEYGDIAFVDGSHSITDFTRTAGCNAQAQKCLTRHETVIWDWRAYEKQCQYAKLGTYAAHVSEKEIIIDQLQAAYIVKNLQPLKVAPYCNLSEAILMENDVIIVFGKQFTPQEVVFKDQPQTFLTEKIIENRDPKNTRFQFLSNTLIENEAKTSCEIWNMLNRIIRQISVKDATAAMRILLKRNDIAARHVDDQFLVTAGYPVEPEKSFLNHQVEEKCYEYLSVQVKGQVVFIAPNTHNVKLHSREVSCPWKPPRNNHEITAGLGLNKFSTERTLFTGNKLPDIEDEWIKLAIDHAKKRAR